MLSELYINNYALIEKAKISFSSGLNVLTGETGAGKSLIMDCIGLVIGGRASSDMVKKGAECTLVEAVFDEVDTSILAEVFEENGLEEFSLFDESLILSREITIGGKSRARINGRLVPLQALKSIGEALLNIYGQHEHQILSRATHHLKILDAYGKDELGDAVSLYTSYYNEWRKIRDLLNELDSDKFERERNLDLLNYQLQEIEVANLEVDEDNRLLEERDILSNYDKIDSELRRTYALISNAEGLEIRSAQDILSEGESLVSTVASCDVKLEEIHTLLSQATAFTDDAAKLIRHYLDTFDFDPERLNQIEERLDDISKLKRKYGATVEEILIFAAGCREKINLLENATQSSSELVEKLEVLKNKTHDAALELSKLRALVASSLEADVSTELKDLGMVNAHLVVDLIDATNGHEIADSCIVNQNGKDSAEFMFTANLGENPKPLAKVASGGELSRIMLAMKSAVSDEVAVMIFDEVDQGVGGRAANAVADKLVKIAHKRQVIVVTHLPQVASRAKTHFLVEKEAHDGRTNVSVTALSQEERVQEIARMIGGKEVTNLTLDAAKEILELANE